jgi:hypothetical protein
VGFSGIRICFCRKKQLIGTGGTGRSKRMFAGSCMASSTQQRRLLPCRQRLGSTGPQLLLLLQLHVVCVYCFFIFHLFELTSSRDGCCTISSSSSNILVLIGCQCRGVCMCKVFNHRPTTSTTNVELLHFSNSKSHLQSS